MIILTFERSLEGCGEIYVVSEVLVPFSGGRKLSIELIIRRTSLDNRRIELFLIIMLDGI